LHLALKTAQRVFQGLTLLDNDFSHLVIHPNSGSDWFSSETWTHAGFHRIYYHTPNSPGLMPVTAQIHFLTDTSEESFYGHSSNQSMKNCQAIFEEVQVLGAHSKYRTRWNGRWAASRSFGLISSAS
jgi:hypothetical protein